MKYFALISIIILSACDKKADETEVSPPETFVEAVAVPAPTKIEAPASGEATYTKATEIEVAEAISTVEVNRAGESFVSGLRLLEVSPLAHESYKGPLGPAKDGLVFFDKRPESETNLLGWVVGKDGDQVKGWRFALQTGNIDEIGDVFFEDIYKDGFQDILVTYSYMTGMGPEGAVPQTVTVAFTYDKAADQFVAHDDLFDKPAENEADARAALRAKGLIK